MIVCIGMEQIRCRRYSGSGDRTRQEIASGSAHQISPCVVQYRIKTGHSLQ
jgi:hypothetical protein